MATTETAPRGSGLYLRGRVWWVRIRTPICIGQEICIRRFWRFSTGTKSRVEALRAAAHVRAALDRGFTLVKLGIGTAMVDAGQMEAMLTQLARNALAATEAARAFSGVRDDARVAEACCQHEEDRGAGASLCVATRSPRLPPRWDWRLAEIADKCPVHRTLEGRSVILTQLETTG